MTSNLDCPTDLAERWVVEGRSPEEVISKLYSTGASMIDSIKIVRTAFGISLGLAKEMVAGHPVWLEVVEKHLPLYDEFLGVAETLGTDSKDGSTMTRQVGSSGDEPDD